MQGHAGGRVGQQLGNYRLLRLLGRGGFGEVYLAEHLYLQTRVAIKVLAAQTDQRIRDLIRTEARTHARLEHQHIAQVFDFGFAEDTPYLVMTYAPGGTLRTCHLQGTRLSPRQIALYVHQIAEALQYAHEHKVVHRDVKPENVLLGNGNTVLLSDFGLAIVAHQTHSLSEQDALGTIAYMAPEQAKGRARPASDQYALGVMVYEWIAGHRPFDGRSTAEVVLKHLTKPPPPLTRPGGSEWEHKRFDLCEQAVMRALAKDPHQRFPHVLAFSQAIEEACADTRPYQAGTVLLSYREHLDMVRAISWSPDGRHIATGSYDMTVRIWDAVTGKTVVTCIGHTATIQSLAWSPDGKLLVSGSDDQTARVWDARTGRQQIIYQGHCDEVEAVAWSPDGTRIASAGNCTVQIWSATSGEHYLTYEGHSGGRSNLYIIFDLAWSPSGFYLASASEDGSLQVWDAATGKRQMIYRGGYSVEGCEWMRDSARIFALDWKSASLLDVENGKKLITYDAQQTVASLALSPENKHLALGYGDGGVQIWNVASGALISTHPLHTQWVRHLSWSPDGARLVSVSEREVYVWRVR